MQKWCYVRKKIDTNSILVCFDSDASRSVWTLFLVNVCLVIRDWVAKVYLLVRIPYLHLFYVNVWCLLSINQKKQRVVYQIHHSVAMAVCEFWQLQIIVTLIREELFNLYRTRCTLVGNSYRCVCPVGFTGEYCETSVSTSLGKFSSKFWEREREEFTIEWYWLFICEGCQSFPCRNGGSCVPLNGNDYTCVCTLSFTGRNCEISLSIILLTRKYSGGRIWISF